MWVGFVEKLRLQNWSKIHSPHVRPEVKEPFAHVVRQSVQSPFGIQPLKMIQPVFLSFPFVLDPVHHFLEPQKTIDESPDEVREENAESNDLADQNGEEIEIGELNGEVPVANGRECSDEEVHHLQILLHEQSV